MQGAPLLEVEIRRRRRSRQRTQASPALQITINRLARKQLGQVGKLGRGAGHRVLGATKRRLGLGGADANDAAVTGHLGQLDPGLVAEADVGAEGGLGGEAAGARGGVRVGLGALVRLLASVHPVVHLEVVARRERLFAALTRTPFTHNGKRTKTYGDGLID